MISEYIMENNRFQSFSVALAGPFPPPYGGFGTQILMLEKHLKKEGVKVYRLPDFHNLWIIPKVIFDFFIKIYKCDIVHILLTGYRSFYRGSISIIIGKILKRKVIIMVEGGFEGFLKSYHRFFAIPILKLVDNICIYSPNQEEIFKKYNLKTIIIEDFTPDFFQYSEKQDIPLSLLINKSLELWSNHRCGIEAFKMIKDRFPNAVLYITGKGSIEEELKSLINELNLKDVKFIGSIEYMEMPKIYNESIILIHPTNRDIFPRTILESFATGTAVVATRIGGIPYMIEDGITGLLVEPNSPKEIAEKIIYLLENINNLHQIIENAKKITDEKYSWTAYKKRLATLYNKSL